MQLSISTFLDYYQIIKNQHYCHRHCFDNLQNTKYKIQLHDYDIPTPSGGDEGDLYAKERQLTDSSC